MAQLYEPPVPPPSLDIEDFDMEDPDEQEHFWLLEQAAIRISAAPPSPEPIVVETKEREEDNNPRPPTPRRVHITRRKSDSFVERGQCSAIVRQGISRSALRRSSRRPKIRHQRQNSDPETLIVPRQKSATTPRRVSRNSKIDARRLVAKSNSRSKISRSTVSSRVRGRAQPKVRLTLAGAPKRMRVRRSPPMVRIEENEEEVSLRDVDMNLSINLDPEENDVEMFNPGCGFSLTPRRKSQFFQSIGGCVGFANEEQ